MSQPKICAVVVTYNRLELLKLCIESLKKQTISLDEILIINNSSTDGTEEWLEKQNDLIFITQRNTGGAGGFHTGIKTAYEKGFDWIWCMDDDVIAHQDALEKLLLTERHYYISGQIGFLASKVLWENGELNRINLPCLWRNKLVCRIDNVNNIEKDCQIDIASFVSILVSREAIKQVGYPTKEYFIYLDDTEYTLRMLKFHNFYVVDSIVTHLTKSNEESRYLFDSEPEIQKSFYGFRNRIYFFKSKNAKHLFRIIASFLMHLIKTINYKKHSFFRLLRLTNAAIYGGFFNQLGEYKKW